MLPDFVILVIVFLAPSQEVGWEECFQNNLFYVEWAVKFNSIAVSTLRICPLRLKNVASQCNQMQTSFM